MEEELDLSTPVERDITSEVEPAAGGVDIAAQAEAELSKMSGSDGQSGEPSADKESTSAWDNPDVIPRLNLNSNNDPLTSNAQQAYRESYGIKGGEDNSQPITEAAKIEKQTKEEEKKADFIERQERESEDRSERRRAEEERSLAKLERMSLGELQQMHAMLSGSAVQKKIEDRLSKGGMSKEQIKKGKSEMEEYLTLRMKEEKEGKDKLTAEEQNRLQEIKQSQEFKSYSVASIKEQGISLSSQNNEHAKASVESGSYTVRLNGDDQRSLTQAKRASVDSISVADMVALDSTTKNSSSRAVSPVAASSRELFPDAIKLTDTYNQSSSGIVGSSNVASLDIQESITPQIARTQQKTTHPAAIVIASL